MLRKFTLLLAMFFPLFCFAQEEESGKKAIHSVGLQINQLLRELVDLGGSGSSVNPYLIDYSVRSRKNGWGFAVGLGYSYFDDKGGGQFNTTEVTNNALSLRMGADSRFEIVKNILVGAGFDLLAGKEKIMTMIKIPNPGRVETTDKSNSWGFGPRITLNYLILGKIMIGTEASYYFKKIKSTFKTVETGSFGNNTFEDTSKGRQFSFTLPTTIRLILIF